MVVQSLSKRRAHTAILESTSWLQHSSLKVGGKFSADDIDCSTIQHSKINVLKHIWRLTGDKKDSLGTCLSYCRPMSDDCVVRHF